MRSVYINPALSFIPEKKTEDRQTAVFWSEPKMRANNNNNKRPQEQTWVCQRENFPGHQFALHFECERFLLDTTLHYIFSLFLYLSCIVTVRFRPKGL